MMTRAVLIGSVVMAMLTTGCSKDEATAPVVPATPSSIFRATVDGVPFFCNTPTALDVETKPEISSEDAGGGRMTVGIIGIRHVAGGIGEDVSLTMTVSTTTPGTYTADARQVTMSIFKFDGPQFTPFTTVDGTATVTVDTADAAARRLVGRFTATLAEPDGAPGRLRVTDGRFDVVY